VRSPGADAAGEAVDPGGSGEEVGPVTTKGRHGATGWRLLPATVAAAAGVWIVQPGAAAAEPGADRMAGSGHSTAHDDNPDASIHAGPVRAQRSSGRTRSA
jgi:hypothetical protein